MVFDIVVEKPQLVSLINWTVTFLHCFHFSHSFHSTFTSNFNHSIFETLVRGLKFYNALLTFTGIDGEIEDAIFDKQFIWLPQDILISTDILGIVCKF